MSKKHNKFLSAALATTLTFGVAPFAVSAAVDFDSLDQTYPMTADWTQEQWETYLKDNHGTSLANYNTNHDLVSELGEPVDIHAWMTGDSEDLNIAETIEKYNISSDNLEKVLQENGNLENIHFTGDLENILKEHGYQSKQVSKSNSEKNKQHKEHLVEAGETFWGIAQEYKADLEKLMEINSQYEATMLPVGAQLVLPKEHKVHLVEAGETFYSIAKEYKVDLEKLMEINSQYEATMLPVGTELALPKDRKVHLVETGETFYSIAKEYNIDLEKLMEMNSQYEATMLPVGAELMVDEKDKIHVVESGDTLYKIAQNYNVTLDTLHKHNPDVVPNSLQIGEEIIVGSGKGEAVNTLK